MNSRDIIVVATSTGGLDALRELFATLPADLPASIFVVMHIGPHPSILPAILQKSCRLPIKHAVDQEEFLDSTIYVAPPDRHLLLHDGKTLLSDTAKENFTRPAADPLFRSAAVAYATRVIGVVLTGELDDGAAGLRAVKACGGFTIVQDPADCRSPSMPLNALRATRADVIAPVAELGAIILAALEPTMNELPSKMQADATIAQTENTMTRTGEVGLSALESIGERSALTCPDCGGVVWRIGDGLPLRYRCHTGHAFSGASLESEQRRQSENAIWQVIRGLEERIFLAHDQLQRETESNCDISELHQRVATLEEARLTAVSLLRIKSP